MSEVALLTSVLAGVLVGVLFGMLVTGTPLPLWLTRWLPWCACGSPVHLWHDDEVAVCRTCEKPHGCRKCVRAYYGPRLRARLEARREARRARRRARALAARERAYKSHAVYHEDETVGF